MVDFFVCDTAKFGIPFIHRNIFKIIQIAEYTHFPELCHSCEKSELNILIHRFEY